MKFIRGVWRLLCSRDYSKPVAHGYLYRGLPPGVTGLKELFIAEEIERTIPIPITIINPDGEAIQYGEGTKIRATIFRRVNLKREIPKQLE